MNIKDIGDEGNIPEKFQGMDMLESMFARQQELIDKYGPIERKNGITVPEYPVDLDSHVGQDHIKRCMLWAIEELMEAANTLKLKPWKQTHVESDLEHFIEELIDFQHFCLELFIAVGLKARDLHEFYFKKSAVNKFRQRSNY